MNRQPFKQIFTAPVQNSGRPRQSQPGLVYKILGARFLGGVDVLSVVAVVVVFLVVCYCCFRILEPGRVCMLGLRVGV